MKINKTRFLWMAAGIAVIAIGGLGFMYWRQLERQDELTQKLTKPQGTPAQLEIISLVSQKTDLQAEIDAAQSQFEAMREVASRQIVSSTITRAIFDLAKKHEMEVTEMVSSAPARKNLDGVDFSVISLTVRAEGKDDKVVAFVSDLNGRFGTGAIDTVNITIPQDPTAGKTQVYAVMSIYTN